MGQPAYFEQNYDTFGRWLDLEKFRQYFDMDDEDDSEREFSRGLLSDMLQQIDPSHATDAIGDDRETIFKPETAERISSLAVQSEKAGVLKFCEYYTMIWECCTNHRAMNGSVAFGVWEEENFIGRPPQKFWRETGKVDVLKPGESLNMDQSKRKQTAFRVLAGLHEEFEVLKKHVAKIYGLGPDDM